MTRPVRSRRRPATALPHTKPSAAEPVVNDAALNWTRDLSLSVEYRPIAELRPAARNARTHSKKQLHQIAASIRQFGFTTPVLVDETGRIMAEFVIPQSLSISGRAAGNICQDRPNLSLSQPHCWTSPSVDNLSSNSRSHPGSRKGSGTRLPR